MRLPNDVDKCLFKVTPAHSLYTSNSFKRATFGWIEEEMFRNGYHKHV